MRCTFRAALGTGKNPRGRPFWHESACRATPFPVNAAWPTCVPSRSGARRGLAALLWLTCASAPFPGGALGQDAAESPAADHQESPAADHQDARAGQGQEAPDRGEEEQARPPGDHPFDIYDALSLPLKVAAAPLALVGYTVRELLRLGFPADSDRGAPRAASTMSEPRDGGVHAGFPALGPRAGPALGVRAEPYGPLFVESAVSWRLYQRHAVGLEWGDATRGSGERLSLIWRRERQPHFWGLGPRTRAEEAADYGLDQAQVAVEIGRPLPGGGARIQVAAEHNRTGPGRDDDAPDLLERSEPGALFGLGEPMRYLRTSASARADAVRWRALQPRGVELEARGTLFHGIAGTPSDFLRLELRATGHLPVTPHQELALLGRFESNEPLAGRGVPFTHLAALGGGVGGRAYPAGRFRHRALAAATAEWRWELWRDIHDDVRAEAFLFAEAGTVARSPEALSVGALRGSWGVGLRGVDAAGLRALGFLAFGAEGARVGGAVRWPH